MLRLLAQHYFSANQHVQTLFVRHSGSYKVNAHLVAVFLCFYRNVMITN